MKSSGDSTTTPAVAAATARAGSPASSPGDQKLSRMRCARIFCPAYADAYSTSDGSRRGRRPISSTEIHDVPACATAGGSFDQNCSGESERGEDAPSSVNSRKADWSWTRVLNGPAVCMPCAVQTPSRSGLAFPRSVYKRDSPDRIESAWDIVSAFATTRATICESGTVVAGCAGALPAQVRTTAGTLSGDSATISGWAHTNAAQDAMTKKTKNRLALIPAQLVEEYSMLRMRNFLHY